MDQKALRAAGFFEDDREYITKAGWAMWSIPILLPTIYNIVLRCQIQGAKDIHTDGKIN